MQPIRVCEGRSDGLKIHDWNGLGWAGTAWIGVKSGGRPFTQVYLVPECIGVWLDVFLSMQQVNTTRMGCLSWEGGVY